MGLHLLDVVFRILGIRGHIPQHGDFWGGGRDVPGGSPLAANGLLRVLAAFVVTFAILSLALWAAVWLTIKIL
jgi:hypothetical protein